LPRQLILVKALSAIGGSGRSRGPTDAVNAPDAGP